MSSFSYTLLLVTTALVACDNVTDNNSVIAQVEKEDKSKSEYVPALGTELIVLGTIQDAGSPQIGCNKKCCKGLFENPDPNRMVVSLGVVDGNGKTYLFEATPDLPRQVEILQKYGSSEKATPDGIFLTHAHIGHYTGLMYLGKEATDAQNVPVYVMPRMKNFLTMPNLRF